MGQTLQLSVRFDQFVVLMTELSFALVALRDITYCREDLHCRSGAHGAQADTDGELGAVATQSDSSRPVPMGRTVGSPR